MRLIAISGRASELAGFIPSLGELLAPSATISTPLVCRLDTASCSTTTLTRYSKLDAAGNELPLDRTDHIILIDRTLGLMIDVRDDREAPHKEALKLAAETDLLGFSDWHLSDDVELLRQADRTRSNPAADLTLYPNAKAKRYWSSLVDPEDSDYAFAVYFHNGYAGWDYRGNRGVVRAVRSLAPPPGQ